MKTHWALLLLFASGCQQYHGYAETGIRRVERKPDSIYIPVDHTIGPVQFVRLKRKPFQGAKAMVVAKRADEWRLSIVDGATEGWFARDEFTLLD